jgi:hypothetical protein
MAEDVEGIPREISVEEKACAINVENPDIGLENATASPKDCI